jgi:hypothetical protein
MPVNGNNATLSGWEMNFVKNLDFLPGPLSNLSLYFNYTSTDSEADYGDAIVRNQHSQVRQQVLEI